MAETGYGKIYNHAYVVLPAPPDMDMMFLFVAEATMEVRVAMPVHGLNQSPP